MIKSFLNGVIGGFSRTLGRILFYVLIALIFYFIFGMKNVDAAELNINANVYSTMGNTYYQRMFTGINYYNGSQSESNFSLGTTYSGRLRDLHFRVDRTFNYVNSYTLTLQANSSDFRNYLYDVLVTDYDNESVCSVVNFQFISKSKMSVTFVCPYQTNSVLFDFYAKEGYFLTGDTNFNIKNVLLEEHTNTQNNDDIINNNNSNTQDIINNNNSNTQDIISSIDGNLNNCRSSVNLWNLGSMVTNSSGITPTPTGFTYYRGSESGGKYVYNLIRVESGKPYTMSFVGGSSNTPLIIYYDTLYGNILAQSSSGTLTFTPSTTRNIYATIIIGSNVSSFSASDIMFYQGSSSIPYEPYGEDICTNKLDDINGGLSDINSSLTNQTPADTSIFSNWWSNLTENYYSNPLGNLITLPVNLVQKLINYSSSSCQPVQLGSLLGHNLTLTCFTLGDYIEDSTILNIIDLIMSLALIVFTLKKSYETVANLLSLGGENEVKQHFKFPTPMEFIATLLGGGN